MGHQHSNAATIPAEIIQSDARFPPVQS